MRFLSTTRRCFSDVIAAKKPSTLKQFDSSGSPTAFYPRPNVCDCIFLRVDSILVEYTNGHEVEKFIMATYALFHTDERDSAWCYSVLYKVLY